MKKVQATTQTTEKSSVSVNLIGKIAQISENGHILVDYCGNSFGALAARITSSMQANLLRKGNPEGREVLLAFDNNDPQRPIIVDTMYSLIDDIAEHSTAVLETDIPREVTINGKRITFDACEEIVLQSGKASITLTKAGKILIKGEYVLSSATGLNKVKGDTIRLN
jgi:hypothetical protein